jgi:hypothetical protein
VGRLLFGVTPERILHVVPGQDDEVRVLGHPFTERPLLVRPDRRRLDVGDLEDPQVGPTRATARDDVVAHVEEPGLDVVRVDVHRE